MAWLLRDETRTRVAPRAHAAALKVMAPRPNPHSGGVGSFMLGAAGRLAEFSMAAWWRLPGVELVERCGQEGVTSSGEEFRVQVWAADLTE
jgi:hypothetical protein